MAAPMKTSSLKSKQVKSKPSQNDLRRLMREKQNAGKEKEKVDSPLAKYNSVGQLFCVLCNCQVKSEIVWTAHVNGRQHRQFLEDVKKQKQTVAASKQQPEFKKPQISPTTATDASSKSFPSSVLKRKVDETITLATSAKRLKSKALSTTPVVALPQNFFDEPATASSSSASSAVEDSATNSSVTNSTSLPSDFFDGDLAVSADDDEEGDDSKPQENTEVVPLTSSVENLPEGFFDDPVVDAKVRKVEYKDPAEEEWERFQKEIAAATNKAQVIIDEDEEESTAERQIFEIDEQINNWARVEALQRRKAELAAKQKADESMNDDDDGAIDEHEFEEFLDWRSKKSLR